MHRLLFAACVLALTVSVPSRPAAQATRPQLLDLADASSLVVTGRVKSVDVRADAGAIYTYATVSVSEVLKGELGETSVVVKVLGGTLGNVGLFIADQASFASDERVLLFLNSRPRDGTLYTVGLSRGKWQVLPDLQTGAPAALNGGERVFIDSGFRSIVAASAQQVEPFIAVPLELAVVAPAFAFIPASEGGPARWHEADDGVHIPVDYQTIPGGLPGGGGSALEAAVEGWNGVGTRLRLDWGQTGNAVCPAQNFTGNGRIALYWNDPCGEIGDGDAATFGVGGGFFTPGFQKTINGVTFNAFLQGLAILNNTGPHLSAAACLRDAVTHVLGSRGRLRPLERFACSDVRHAATRVFFRVVRAGLRRHRRAAVHLSRHRQRWPSARCANRDHQLGGPGHGHALLDAGDHRGPAPGLHRRGPLHAHGHPSSPRSIQPTRRRLWSSAACSLARISCACRHATRSAPAHSRPGRRWWSVLVPRRVRRPGWRIRQPTIWSPSHGRRQRAGSRRATGCMPGPHPACPMRSSPCSARARRFPVPRSSARTTYGLRLGIRARSDRTAPNCRSS